MALWLVRAGKYGEMEDFALQNKVAVIGWSELPDLSTLSKRSELHSLLDRTYPDLSKNTRSNWEGQLWRFIHEFKAGDLIALPLKHRASIAFGEVAGDYQFIARNPVDARHLRPVKSWQELTRNCFDQSLLASFNALSTVCQIQRNRAEDRVKALLSGNALPVVVHSAQVPDDTSPENDTDLEQIASDQISEFINRKYKGHGLARLVGAVLEAQGYQVRVSPEGADGGVDIIAGRGPLGFEPPRLVVQVKSGDAPVDVGLLRELAGVMTTFGADQGLIVAWRGYRGVVEKESTRQFFKIRLWDSGNLVRMIQENYEQLSPSIQAELPLKRIWTLVQTSEE